MGKWPHISQSLSSRSIKQVVPSPTGLYFFVRKIQLKWTLLKNTKEKRICVS
nr:MAG TPA: hypothetical protein [Caudoviricetes sp.]